MDVPALTFISYRRDDTEADSRSTPSASAYALARACMG
jgi:hypothetical protein